MEDDIRILDPPEAQATEEQLPDGTNELCDMLIGICNGDSKMKTLFQAAMADYTITKKEKAIIVYDGGRTEHLIKRFLLAKKVAGCTDRTLELYGHNLRQAFKTINKTPDEWQHTDVQIYMAICIKAGNGSDTLSNKWHTLSSFYGWLADEDIIHRNICKKTDPPKKVKKHKEAFSDLDVEKIRNACKDKREKAVVEILLSTALRVFELAKLSITDVQTDEVTVLGKGQKERKVYLNAKAQLAIAEYLATRKDTNPYLFPASIAKDAGRNRRDATEELNKIKSRHTDWWLEPDLVSPLEHLGTDYIEKKIRELGKRAGVKKCHPHRFRRTCATMALKRGMSLVAVQHMLGHDSLDTTRRYLDLDDETLKNEHKKYVT